MQAVKFTDSVKLLYLHASYVVVGLTSYLAMLLSRGTRKNLLLEVGTEIQSRYTFAVCGSHLLLLLVTV